MRLPTLAAADWLRALAVNPNAARPPGPLTMEVAVREPSNLPPGVTDRMIEEAQADPYAGTRYEARAYAILDARERLMAAVHQMAMHRHFGCAVNHDAGCPWPARMRRNPRLEEEAREIVTKLDAELFGIDTMLQADEEERRS